MGELSAKISKTNICLYLWGKMAVKILTISCFNNNSLY
jgi:hypothetical protein